MFTCAWRVEFGTVHGRLRPVGCMAALSVSCRPALGGRCNDLVTAGVNKVFLELLVLVHMMWMGARTFPAGKGTRRICQLYAVSKIAS